MYSDTVHLFQQSYDLKEQYTAPRGKKKYKKKEKGKETVKEQEADVVSDSQEVLCCIEWACYCTEPPTDKNNPYYKIKAALGF